MVAQGDTPSLTLIPPIHQIGVVFHRRIAYFRYQDVSSMTFGV